MRKGRLVDFLVYFLLYEADGSEGSWEVGAIEFFRFLISYGFFVCYLIVGLYWVELSRSISHKYGLGKLTARQIRRLRNRIILFLTIFSVLIFAIMCVLGVLLDQSQLMTLIIAVGYFSVLSFVTVVVFIVYGKRLRKSLTRMDGIMMYSSERDRSVRKIGLVAIIGTTSFMIRALVIVLYDIYFIHNTGRSTSVSIYIGFYVFVECIPLMATMMVLSPTKIMRYSSTTSPKNAIIHPAARPMVLDSTSSLIRPHITAHSDEEDDIDSEP
jgi:hypothetical protein